MLIPHERYSGYNLKMHATSNLPFITIVLPALNEERYIENCVRSLLDDPYPRERLEFFIVDGGSTDRTLEIAGRLSREFPFLRILHNAKKLQGPGMNMAVRAADPRSEYVVRFDVHAEYRPNFISIAIEVATFS